MTVIGYPFDAVTGAPSYSGRKLRETLAALLGGATSARPLGAFSGVRPGTSITTVSNTGFTWNVATHAGVVDLESAAEAGPYLYAVTVIETGTITAAIGGNTRTDLICVKVDDPAESDGSSAPAMTITYTAGAAGGAVPATPARSMVLGKINVPASGGGNPTVTWMAPTLAAAGAPFRRPLVSDLAALPAFPDAEAIIASTPGATWRYVSGVWTMFGVAQFADSAARVAAIAAPVANMKSRLATEQFDRRYTGSTWAADNERVIGVTNAIGTIVAGAFAAIPTNPCSISFTAETGGRLVRIKLAFAGICNAGTMEVGAAVSGATTLAADQAWTGAAHATVNGSFAEVSGAGFNNYYLEKVVFLAAGANTITVQARIGGAGGTKQVANMFLTAELTTP